MELTDLKECMTKALLIVFCPSAGAFVVGKSTDLAAKGAAALLARFVTGNDNPFWLVGEVDSLAEALHVIQRFTDRISQATAKPQLFVAEFHVRSGASEKEAGWN